VKKIRIGEKRSEIKVSIPKQKNMNSKTGNGRTEQTQPKTPNYNPKEKKK
jgi:hypothetical protein